MGTLFLPPCEQKLDITKLKEHTLYEIKIAWDPANPIHQAFLFMGFHNGNYCVVYSNAYEFPSGIEKAYWVQIVRELAPIEN